MMPPVYCVVLNYRGWADTIACLESLLRSDYPALRVIVVDNASPDDSVERILAWARGEIEAPVPPAPLSAFVAPPLPKPMRVRVVGPGEALAADESSPGGQAPGSDALTEAAPSGWAAAARAAFTLFRSPDNRGFAAGNNHALRRLLEEGAQGYAWLLNNDTIVAPDTLSRLVEAARAELRCGAVGATLLDFGDPRRVQEAAGGTVTRWHGMVRPALAGAHLDALPDAAPWLDYVSGCSLILPLDVVREVGLLDERLFMYADDVDWSVRMRATGRTPAWARDARVWHRGGGSASHGGAIHDYHNVHSALLFVAKHHRRLVPLSLGYVLYRAVLPKVVRGEWSRLRTVHRAVRDFLREYRREGGGDAGAGARAKEGAPAGPLGAGSSARGATPLRAGLLARNPLLLAWLLVGSAAAWVWAAAWRGASPMGRAPRDRDTARAAGAAPRRVLLCVTGHIGDGIIATAAIRDLKAALPHAEIGVAASPMAALALRGHPGVARVHLVPHWRLDRGDRGSGGRIGALAGRIWRIWRTRAPRRAAAREIAAARYDVAVDLGAHYPNMATILALAGVSRRIGWRSGGFASLYTESLPWRDGEAHEAERHRVLLAALLAPVKSIASPVPVAASATLAPASPPRRAVSGNPWPAAPEYWLPPGSEADATRARALLRELGVDGPYIVLHPGAGSPAKRWPDGRWLALAERLAAMGETNLLVTGQGAEDTALARRIATEVAGVAIAVDRLEWGALGEVVRTARAVACPDTAVAHLAAASHTPCVVLFTGIDRPSRWRPLGGEVTVLTRGVPCAPCHRGEGCAAMTCIREIAVDEVMAALRALASSPSRMEAV